MNYLQPSEYEAYGLEATTPAALVTAASSLIDAHCRRATLGIAQYQDRVRLADDRITMRLNYLPLVAVPPATSPIVSARGRYTIPRRGEATFGSATAIVALVFGLPGTWTDIDISAIDIYAETGELTFPINAIGLSFSEVEIAYTAGFAELPTAIKVACAQIVKNAQATPALNVRSEKLDRLRMDYFSDTLLDQTVITLLADHVAQKVG